MANCSNCSAPLTQESISCQYCGSRNDVDLKGVHYFTTHSTDSGRICPRCSINLTTIDLKLNGTFLIERCEECMGLFFDPNELETLLEATINNVFTVDNNRLNSINATKKEPFGISYVKCPVCSVIMNRVSFGLKSGVVIDRCKAHGVWLDGGELRQLFEWMKAGGRLLQVEREEERLNNERRELEREKRRFEAGSSSGISYSSDSSFELFGNTLKDSDPDLFTMVAKAVRFFTR